MQQRMKQKLNVNDVGESEASKILSANAARAKRYFDKIEAGARKLLAKKEKTMACAEEVVAGGGGAVASKRAAGMSEADIGAAGKCGERVVSGGNGIGIVPRAGTGVVGKEGMVGGENGVSCAAGEGGERGAIGESAAVVCGVKQRCEQLWDKKGTMRPTSSIAGLMPPGSLGLKTKLPRRKTFGAEGAEGDAAHEMAMKEFKLKEFGSAHVQGRTLDSVSSRARAACVASGACCDGHVACTV